MSGALPSWYPLANATDAQIEAWFKAERRPYDEMRDALLWLKSETQLDGWLDAARNIDPDIVQWLVEIFPRIAAIPLPPKRRAEVEQQ